MSQTSFTCHKLTRLHKVENCLKSLILLSQIQDSKVQLGYHQI